jgi:hypothetical protein
MWVQSTAFASCHPSGIWNFEVVPIFFFESLQPLALLLLLLLLLYDMDVSCHGPFIIIIIIIIHPYAGYSQFYV